MAGKPQNQQKPSNVKPFPVPIGGINQQDSPELIEKHDLADASGFIYKEGLLRKEHEIIEPIIVMDKAYYRAPSDTALCSINCPEAGNTGSSDKGTEKGNGGGSFPDSILPPPQVELWYVGRVYYLGSLYYNVYVPAAVGTLAPGTPVGTTKTDDAISSTAMANDLTLTELLNTFESSDDSEYVDWFITDGLPPGGQVQWKQGHTDIEYNYKYTFNNGIYVKEYNHSYTMIWSITRVKAAPGFDLAYGASDYTAVRTKNESFEIPIGDTSGFYYGPYHQYFYSRKKDSSNYVFYWRLYYNIAGGYRSSYSGDHPDPSGITKSPLDSSILYVDTYISVDGIDHLVSSFTYQAPTLTGSHISPFTPKVYLVSNYKIANYRTFDPVVTTNNIWTYNVITSLGTLWTRSFNSSGTYGSQYHDLGVTYAGQPVQGTGEMILKKL